MIWVGMAVLWLFPANDGPDGVGSALTSAAGSSPAWLAHFQTSLAGVVHDDGLAVSIALALLSLLIGVGPLVTRRCTMFLIVGAALSMDYWVLGQSFGGIATGIATDPNTGPLFVLLALALFPNGAPPLRLPSSETVGGDAPVTESTGRDERILIPA